MFQLNLMDGFFHNDKLNKKGIYRIYNRITDKSYIGKTGNSIHARIYKHYWMLKRGKHHNIHLQRSFNKHGADVFSFEALYAIDMDNHSLDLNLLETECIHIYDSYKNGYNRSIGGEGTKGLVFSEEQRKKLSETLKGHSWNRGVRRPNFKLTPKKLENLSKLQKIQIGENHPNSTITETEVLDICNRIINGESTKSIGLDFSIGTVRSIRYGKTWKHITKYYINKFPTPSTDAKKVKENIIKNPEILVALYKELGSVNKVTKELKVDKRFVSEILKENEVLI